MWDGEAVYFRPHAELKLLALIKKLFRRGRRRGFEEVSECDPFFEQICLLESVVFVGYDEQVNLKLDREKFFTTQRHALIVEY